MASWNELVAYMRANYKLDLHSSGEMASMLFPIEDRTQLVFVSKAGNDALGEWACIESAIGDLKDLDLTKVCGEVDSNVIGGIVVKSGMDKVFLRHTVPLVNLDINEFKVPLVMITLSADVMEKKFTRKDKH